MEEYCSSFTSRSEWCHQLQIQGASNADIIVQCVLALLCHLLYHQPMRTLRISIFHRRMMLMLLVLLLYHRLCQAKWLMLVSWREPESKYFQASGDIRISAKFRRKAQVLDVVFIQKWSLHVSIKELIYSSLLLGTSVALKTEVIIFLEISHHVQEDLAISRRNQVIIHHCSRYVNLISQTLKWLATCARCGWWFRKTKFIKRLHTSLKNVHGAYVPLIPLPSL